MPRAFDKFPTQRGMGGDSLHSPTRGGLPWQNPFDAIAGTAADTMGAIGQFVRAWFELDMLDEAFAEFGDAFTAINWSSPQAIRDAVAAAGHLLADIGRWVLAVIENFLQGDLTEHSEFVAHLVEVLAFDVLHEAWTTFSTGWQALNWAEPLTAIHPAWMLLVDFGWGIGGWLSQIVENIFGISLPGFFALADLRAHWTTFFTAWGAINWTNPLAGIHAAWKALVDLGSNLADWALTVLRNLTGIELPSFLDLDTLKEVWHDFETEWATINWASLSALWAALTAIGNLLRGLAHWAIGVFRNLTGIDLHGIADSFGITALAAALTAWATTLAGLDWGDPGAALMSTIGAFITLAQDLGNWLLGVIESWLGWSVSTVHDMFSSVGAAVEKVIEYFWGAEGVAGWVHTIESLAGEVGASITAAIQAVYAGAQRFVAMFGEFGGLRDLVTFFGDLFSPDGLLGWLARARDQITQPPVIDFGLDGIRQKLEELFGGIPVSQINDAAVSLISQGNFNNEVTIIPGGGWSWDGTVTATGTGGSAKCEATGALQQLFSRQVVKVANGDRVEVTAQVRTDGFTAAAGRYMELAIIPWKLVANVFTAQTPVVIATRTAASEGSWATMSGSTYVVANDVIRLTVRLSVVAHSGATVRFDNVFPVKSGGLLQELVDNLLPTWEGFWAAVFGGSGAGKIWSDAITALSTVKINAGLGISKGDNANGNALGIIDSIGKAVFGEGVYQTLPGQVKTTLQHFINRLFGINTVGSELTGDVLPPLDASTILYGELPTARLNMPSIGATINPSAGSGALLIRSASNPVAPRSYSRNYAPDGFFTSLQVASSDISCLKTDGNPGTGTRNDFAGAFKVANAGWYQVELSVRINVGFANGAFSCAPVLFKGSTLAGCTAYKIGSDSHTIYVGGFPVTQVQHRFVQNSWIVYLAANEIVRAGFDCLYAGAATSGLGGESGTGTSGTETYFSISLLNKSFA